MMQHHKNFVWKIVRNGFLLAGAMFFALWSTQEINFLTIKPVITFFGSYIFAELINYFRIPQSKKGEIKTLIL